MDYTLNFTPWNPISSKRCTWCWPRVARFFWPTVLAWRKWDEVEGSGTGRAQGGREKKGGWGFKKSWASDADGEWKRLPWKPGPASSESMSKWGEGERSKWMDERKWALTRGICLICLTFFTKTDKIICKQANKLTSSTFSCFSWPG